MKRNTNYLHVTIKQDRQCKRCSRKILKGTKCLTVSSRSRGRFWYCNSCEEWIREVEKTKAKMLNTSDDGEYYANFSYLMELEQEEV